MLLEFLFQHCVSTRKTSRLLFPYRIELSSKAKSSISVFSCEYLLIHESPQKRIFDIFYQYMYISNTTYKKS